MATEIQAVDIGELPELVRLAEEVRATRTPRLLRRDDEDVAIIMPCRTARPRARRKGVLTRDDPLFRSIGSGRSGIPGGISGRKYNAFKKALGPADDSA